MSNILEKLDHPLLFILFLVLLVTAGQKLFKVLFANLGWQGPESLFS